MSTPFRWSLVPRDQLGSLLDVADPPVLPDFDELVQRAAKVPARSGGGRPLVVGRSADSLFDLLGGALQGTDHQDRIARPAYSFTEDPAKFAQLEVARARAVLAAGDLTPEHLLRREPTALGHLVHEGRTVTGLYRLLQTWAAEQNAPWTTARLKLRFVGITSRRPTSPKTWRWQQHADWVEELPAGSVANVSLDPGLWS